MTATSTTNSIVARFRGNRRRRRHGFTLVEILTVVAILLVLIGIAAIAMRGLDQSRNATRGTLQNLQSMLAEYESAAGLRNQPAGVWRNGSFVTLQSTPTLNIWQERANLESAAGASKGIVASGSLERYQWDAVANTQLVYQIINRIPANKQVLSRLPKQLHGHAEERITGGKKLIPRNDDTAIEPPLILDAWGNPIIFVGREGLRLVGVDRRRETSGDMMPGTEPAHFNQVVKVTSAGVVGPDVPAPAGARPFFASAGADGNFRTHEDNVYSYEAQ